MTTFTLTKDSKIGKLRALNVDASNVSISFSVDLIDENGDVLFAGKQDNFNTHAMPGKPGEADPNAEARAALKEAIETAFAGYFQTVNG